jgi:hypothetical protein
LPDLEKCSQVNETCSTNPLRKMECCSGLYCAVEWAGFGTCYQNTDNTDSPVLEQCGQINEGCSTIREDTCCPGLYCALDWGKFGNCAQKKENLCKTKYEQCNLNSNECCQTLHCLLTSDNQNYCMLLE